MTVDLAIYQVEVFEVKHPLGPRQVRVYTKQATTKTEVPDEAAEQLKGIRELNSDKLIEGNGHILVQSPQGIFPQPVGFPFDEGIANATEAFEKFDEYMEKHVKQMQAAENRRSNGIARASEMDLKRIDAAQKQTKSGLIVP